MLDLTLNSNNEWEVVYETLWSTACGDPYSDLVWQPANPESITAFEAMSGFTLPTHHREFLLRVDGGQVGSVIHFGTEGLEWHVTHWLPVWAKRTGVMPIGTDGCGDRFCYDLHRPGPEDDYVVLRWDHAAYDRGEGPDAVWSEYASGFLEFLARGLKKKVKPPAIVLTEGGAEYWFDGVRRSVVEWAQVDEVAINVVVPVFDGAYSEAVWFLTGLGAEFWAPVGLVAGAEPFAAHSQSWRGFDIGSLLRAREAARCHEAGVLVCWSRERSSL
jgi:cell wall assembly regulator SMI1